MGDLVIIVCIVFIDTMFIMLIMVIIVVMVTLVNMVIIVIMAIILTHPVAFKPWTYWVGAGNYPLNQECLLECL